MRILKRILGHLIIMGSTMIRLITYMRPKTRFSTDMRSRKN